MTYSWLRSKQEDAETISAGIILYLNELVPSKEDLVLIKDEIINDLTDIPQDNEFLDDIELILDWDDFKIARSIRFIEINEEEKRRALEKFDTVVSDIENSMIREMKGCKIQDAWKAEADKRTCSACDFRTFCKNNSDITKDFKIP